MRILRAVVVLLLASLAWAVAQGNTALQEGQSRISTTGTGVVYGEPDVATVRLGVSAEDPDVEVAVDEVDAGIERIIAELMSLGIAEREIRTVSYNVFRDERLPQGAGEQPPAVYRAVHMLAVEVEGAERAGEVLSAAVEAGANSVGGIDFRFSDPAQLQARARELAVADARERAMQLATAAGVELGAPFAIEEIGPGASPRAFVERSALTLDAASIEPGELSVEVTVTISYRIDDGP